MSDTMDEIDKKIISAIEKDKSKLIYIGDIHDLTGVNEEIIQDRLRYLYTTQKIFTFSEVCHCNACYYADIYQDDEQGCDMFCKLLTKRLKNIEHIPKECPLRSKKYYVELFVE